MLLRARCSAAGHTPGAMSMHAQHSGVLPRQDTCLRGELDAPAEPLLPGAKDRIQVSAHTTVHSMLCHDALGIVQGQDVLY